MYFNKQPVKKIDIGGLGLTRALDDLTGSTTVGSR